MTKKKSDARVEAMGDSKDSPTASAASGVVSHGVSWSELLAALKKIAAMPVGPSEHNGATFEMKSIATRAIQKAAGR